MTDIKASPVIRRNADIPKAQHKYALDDKRVFIVSPVYRSNGESAKEILTKLMREEARKN
jgi:hypothetical protein